MKNTVNLLIVVIILTVGFTGCQKLNLNPQGWLKSASMRSQSPDEDETTSEIEKFETKVDTPFIGEYTQITGKNLIALQGVGLVTGLNGTGGNPPPSVHREALLREMRRRNVKNPNQILRSPSTALVIVKAYLPPLIRKGETFDVEVYLPGNSEATSLEGGWLMESYLAEQAMIQGRGLLKGHILAKAQGPILIPPMSEEDRKKGTSGLLRRGRILAGGISVAEDRDLALYLRNDFKSIRNAQRIANRIGTRFHHFDKYGIEEPLAEAKTDKKVVLKLKPRYKHNDSRYLQVVRYIAFRETDVAQRVRMQKLTEEIMIPEKAERASIELEAIGKKSIPILKSALKSPLLEVRFHAAVALAYLDDGSGIKDLADAAREEPAFRVYALAAMSALDEPEAHLHLRELMSMTSAETRYGAFRALWTLDKNDPFIRGEDMNGQFLLHVLQTELETVTTHDPNAKPGGPKNGGPMIHVTHRKHPEVVLFGSEQEFRVPLTVRAGKVLITGAPGAEQLTVSKYEVDEPDQRKLVSKNIAVVIRTAVDMGASYPDIAQMILQAHQQGNIEGQVEIDALPEGGRMYYRPVHDDSLLALKSGDLKSSKPKPRKGSRVGNQNMVPNIFTTDAPITSSSRRADSEEGDEPEFESADETDGKGKATLADSRKPKSTDEDDKFMKQNAFQNWFRYFYK
ncbi:MAG: flagellar basal body P-ring protein FlgI [Planctomycetaceae bacterium]|nr:flagellar basal body P-ring protein FlgI [Planctomycetaceae bacterium]